MCHSSLQIEVAVLLFIKLNPLLNQVIIVFHQVIGEYANEKSASFTRPLTSNKKGEERERTCRKLTLLTHNTNTLIATFENNFYNL